MCWPLFKKSRFTILLACFLALFMIQGTCIVAQAAPADPARNSEGKNEQTTQEKAKGVVKLEDVTVHSGKETFTAIEATSATVLGNDQIIDRIYGEVIDLVLQSPGVYISHYNWGGGASGVKMRGFSNIGHSRDGVIALDGVLVNDLSHADYNMVIPEEVETVEIVKGPASVLYGNYNSGGSISFKTFQSGDFTRFKLQYGSFNTGDAVAVIARRDGKWDHVYAVEARHTDGYQNNSTWDKQIAAGRWTYHVSDRLDAKIAVRGYNSTWEMPGYLPRNLYDSSPGLSATDVMCGHMKWGTVQAGLDYKVQDQAKLQFLTWYNGSDRGMTNQYYITPSQVRGSNYGNDTSVQRDAYGARFSYDLAGKILDRETRVVLGVERKSENEQAEKWNLTVGGGRTRGSKTQNDDYTLDTTAAYCEINYQLMKPLRLVLGGRYDYMEAEMDSTLRAQSSYDRDGQGIFSPKAGLILTVVKDWDLYANWVKGFTLPDVPTYMVQDLDPAIRTQYEGGLRAKPTSWMDFAFCLWRMDTTDDFIPKLSDPTVQENAGETRREGVEAELNLFPIKDLRLHVDYGYIHAEYRNFVQGGVKRDGNELPSVPNHLFNAEVAWQPSQGLGARINYRYVSEWWLEAANTNRADGFDVVSAQVSYRFDKRYKLALDVINLFDNKYSEYQYVSGGERYYGVADPLSVYLTLTIDW